MFAIYWIVTVLLVFMLLFSAYSYLYSQPTIEGVRALGFPDFFRIQLVVLKLLAVIVLVIPWGPLIIKDWAYAGVGLFFLTAFVAHYVNKDPIWINIVNVVFFAFVVLSRMYYSKIFK